MNSQSNSHRLKRHKSIINVVSDLFFDHRLSIVNSVLAAFNYFLVYAQRIVIPTEAVVDQSGHTMTTAISAHINTNGLKSNKSNLINVLSSGTLE